MRLEAQFNLSQGGFQLAAKLVAGLHGVTGLFGPSGSGKTTFLRCLAGLTRATDGYVRFGEQVWQDEKNGIFLPPHQRPVGVMFQESRLFTHLTVRKNLEFGYKRCKGRENPVTFDDVVAILQLEPFLARLPEQLSGGEQQRVAMGRAILTGPELLLMDEPMASMDHQGKKGILGYIRRLQSQLQLPILHVSHDMGEILQLADDLALMKAGRITAIGPIGDMITRLELPLAHRSDAGAILTATVISKDEEYHLSTLNFGSPAQSLFIANSNLEPGDEVRIRILARDVSLTPEHPGKTSILNLLSAEVMEVVAENPAQYMVKLQVGGQPILSRITKKSRDNLEIKKGQPLIAQVKSMALER